LIGHVVKHETSLNPVTICNLPSVFMFSLKIFLINCNKHCSMHFGNGDGGKMYFVFNTVQKSASHWWFSWWSDGFSIGQPL